MADINQDHQIDGVFGALIFAVSILGNAWNWLAEWFSIDKLNTIVVLVASVLAVLYTWHKLRGQRIQNKIKKLELEKMEKDEDLERHTEK